MRRRDFIALVGGGIASSPFLARGKEPGRNYRVGGLYQAPWEATHHIAFREELSRLGFIDGQNLVLDRDGHAMRPEQFAEHATQLVKNKVDVIHCGGDAAIRAAQQATATIPILGLTDDMVGAGFVRSLANPGGNTTGV